MAQPLTNRVIDDGKLGNAAETSGGASTMTTPAETAKPVSVWKPVILRVVVGGFALLGLAGVGAASMLAGLDGAHANPPTSVSVRALANEPAPTAGAPQAAASPAAVAPGPNASTATPPAVQGSCNVGRTSDGRVVLNAATVTDLRTLPGIGEKRAQAILNLREKLKKFRRIQELRRVRGIGAKTLQRLAPKLLIDPPAGSCAG